MNKAILIGNTGNAPEIVSFDNGNQIARVSLATTKNWKDKTTQERKSVTTWHALQFEGPLVSIVEKYVNKGDKLSIVGEIQNYEYTGNDGVKKYGSRIRVNELELLTPKQQSTAPNISSGIPDVDPIPQPESNDDDLPF